MNYAGTAALPLRGYPLRKTIRKVAREQTDLSDEELDEVLDARKMTEA